MNEDIRRQQEIFVHKRASSLGLWSRTLGRSLWSHDRTIMAEEHRLAMAGLEAVLPAFWNSAR